MANDPVCGMMVDPQTAEFRTEHNGQTYYFCSKACRTEFLLHASNYTKKNGFFGRFLDWIAKGNADKFNGKPPSCCDNKMR